jgi:hypothetical protein
MTASAPTRQSAINALCKEVAPILPGVYGSGLITLLDEDISRSLLAEWTWLVPRSSAPFAVTGFGDVFFLDSGCGVYFLDVQAAHVEFVDASASWAINEFLAQPTIVEKVLRGSQLEALVAAHRAIRYGEVFILRPWEVLGGNRWTGPYDIGKVDVYLHLVGQTIRQVLKPASGEN